MPEQTQDHDLLIRIHTQFESFEKVNSTLHANLNDKIVTLMTNLSSKAEKEDLREIHEFVKNVDVRLAVLEKKTAEYEIKKQTVINLGNMGIKGWSLITAAIGLFLALFSKLTK